MFIKSISIENFGNFHKQEFTFKEGMNSFIHENGWGKSTLAAFIKAMLYGMDEKGRKKEGFFERERYFPWNGGKFGGNMIFSTGKKEYRVTRFFDRKKKELDTCEIWDMTSALKAVEFSDGEELGIQLFGIDRDSFERSCFVNLDKEKLPALSDNINAKLNGLLDDSDDVGNYESADRILSSAISLLQAPRARDAVIRTIESDIENRKESLDKISSMERTVAQLSVLMESESQKKNSASKRISELEAKKENISLYEKRRLHESMKKSLDEKISMEKQYTDFFNGKIPSESEIVECLNLNNRISQLEMDIRRNELLPEEKLNYSELKDFFAGDVPSVEQIEKCRSELDEKKDLLHKIDSAALSEAEQRRLEVLEKQFSGTEVSPEIISAHIEAIRSAEKLQQELDGMRREKESLEAQKKSLEEESLKKKRIARASGITLFVFFAASASVFFFVFSLGLLVSAFLCGFALCSICTGLLFSAGSKKIKELSDSILSLCLKIQDAEDRYNSVKDSYTGFINQIHPGFNQEIAQYELLRIENEWQAYGELLQKKTLHDSASKNNPRLSELSESIEAFTLRYEARCRTAEPAGVLAMLSQRLQPYREYSRRMMIIESSGKELDSARKNLNEILSKWNADESGDTNAKVSQIQKNLLALENIRETLPSEKAAVKKFESENDMEKIYSAEEPLLSLEQVNQEYSAASKELLQAEKNINDYAGRINDCELEMDRKSDYENEISVLEEKLAVAKERAEDLSLARTFLKTAYESLSDRYMGKMESAFTECMKLSGSARSILIDRNMDVKVEGEGSLYGSDYLSEGYKDLVNFCTRIALISAMFTDEQPVVILDDPFVNLDEDKIANARNIVASIAQKRQVLYFACHDSRCIQKDSE